MAAAEAASGAVSGATTGAGIGTSISPGYGTAIGAGIGALGGLVSGILSGNAAERAAAQQQAQLEAALAFQKERYGEAQTNLNPFIKTGIDANNEYANLVHGMTMPEYTYKQTPFSFDVNSDPGAQYAMQQAQQALNASSIARGAVGGGAAKSMATAIMDKGNESFGNAYQRWLNNSKLLQGQADNAFQRANEFQLNRIKASGDVAGRGQQAAAELSGLGSTAGQTVGNTLGSIGSAQAAGTMGAGNAIASGISGFGSTLGSGIASQSNQQTTADYINKLIGNRTPSGSGVSGGISGWDSGVPAQPPLNEYA